MDVAVAEGARITLLAPLVTHRKGEFRDLLGGRFTLFAIHDFNPALPWFFYRYTQAVVHGLVMKGFQGHMEQAAEGGPML